jgi:PhoPQ-activated pathogenicity-related protein
VIASREKLVVNTESSQFYSDLCDSESLRDILNEEHSQGQSQSFGVTVKLAKGKQTNQVLPKLYNPAFDEAPYQQMSLEKPRQKVLVEDSWKPVARWTLGDETVYVDHRPI